MIFGQAIPLRKRPQYFEGSSLAPSRDTRNNAFLWKKARTESNQQVDYGSAIAKLSRELAKMRRRIVGGFIPPDLEIYLPFQFYNTSNTSLLTDGSKKQSGQNWQTFQMRDGILSARSLWGGFDPSGFIYEGTNRAAPGYQTMTAVINDNAIFYEPTTSLDALSNFVKLSNTVDTVIYDPFVNPLGNGQIILDPKLDSDGAVFASFWLKIMDSSSSINFYATLNGRMWDSTSTAGRPTQPFPDGNIIPLATLGTGPSFSAPNIQQIQIGNVVEAYSLSEGGNATGTNLRFRGDYTNDILQNQYVYPGDLVTNGSITVSGKTIPLSYIAVSFFQMTTPPGLGPSWRGGFAY